MPDRAATSKRVWLAGALLFAAGIAILATVDAGRGAPAGKESREAVARPGEPPGLATHPGAPPTNGPMPPDVWIGADEEVEEVEEDVPPTDGPVRLAVKVGGEASAREAVLDLRLFPEDEAQEVRELTVRVTAPSWEARIPLAAHYDVTGVRIDRKGTNQTLSDLVPDAEHRLLVTLWRPVEVVLSVVDESSGEPIPYASVLPLDKRSGGPDGTPYPHDLRGTAFAFRTDAVGSLSLPASAVPSGWWVVAKGHVTARVRTSPDSAATCVRLPRAGSVRIEVTSREGTGDTRVVLERGDAAAAPGNDVVLGASVDAFPRVEDGVYLADGLEPGIWRAVVGRKSDPDFLERWAQTDVRITVGVEQTLRLLVEPESHVDLPMLRFRVRLPAGSKQAPTGLRVRGIGKHNRDVEREAEPDGDPAGPIWTFGVRGRFPHGPYQVEVEPFAWGRVFRLPLESRGVDLAVPPLVALRVRVVDADTGADLQAATVLVHWYPARDREASPPASPPDGDDDAREDWTWRCSTTAEPREPGQAAFVASVPAGDVSLLVSARGHRTEYRYVDLVAPEAEVTVRLREEERSDPAGDEGGDSSSGK